MLCDTLLHSSLTWCWLQKASLMEQNFRRAHQMLLATTCQLCCTWKTSLNAIKQPCRCNQGRDLFYWNSYSVCLQSSSGFGFNSIHKLLTHTPQDATNQVMTSITFCFFKKVHLMGTAFSNKVTPWRCADFCRPRKAELGGNPNRAAERNRYSTSNGNE